jgi:hypothetical protein
MLAFCPPLLAQVTLPDVPGHAASRRVELALGVLLIGVGLAALALYARPLRREAASLPWFGLFAVLYGLRLLARTGTLPLFFGYPPAPLQVVAVETSGRPVVVGGDVAVWFGELDEPQTEGQLRLRALDPELVWLAHTHEPWRSRAG